MARTAPSWAASMNLASGSHRSRSAQEIELEDETGGGRRWVADRTTIPGHVPFPRRTSSWVTSDRSRLPILLSLFAGDRGGGPNRGRKEASGVGGGGGEWMKMAGKRERVSGVAALQVGYAMGSRHVPSRGSYDLTLLPDTTMDFLFLFPCFISRFKF
jgi:hypothetical protein